MAMIRWQLFIWALLVCARNAVADWPDFRGPWANGYASAPSSTNHIGLPLHWSETEHVKWKTSIPHFGLSSPIILGNQVWLTTASTDGHDFFAICVDSESGKILFNEPIFHCADPEPLGNDLNSYASPSAVVEPGRVYVHFGSYGTACLDTRDFKVLWKRDDLPCRHFRGPGSSPILFGDFIILSMDGIDLQYMVALDKQTGTTIWKTDRTANWNDLEANGRPRGDGDYRKAYYTPIVANVQDHIQIITAGSKAAYGYDPLTGREIWKVDFTGFSGASRPVYGKGVAYICTGHGRGEVLAIRADGSGDITGSNIQWRGTRGSPCMPSPVLVEDLLFVVSDGGIASCLDATTGKQYWQERLGGDFAASLLYGDGRLYCFGQNGTATVIEASRNFQVLATNKLDQGCLASPAVDGRALILRTKTHLYRIEEK